MTDLLLRVTLGPRVGDVTGSERDGDVVCVRRYAHDLLVPASEINAAVTRRKVQEIAERFTKQEGVPLRVYGVRYYDTEHHQWHAIQWNISMTPGETIPWPV